MALTQQLGKEKLLIFKKNPVAFTQKKFPKGTFFHRK